MLTSAKLPSIAFLRKVSLGLSFANEVAIESANTVAVPSAKTNLFTASSYGIFCQSVNTLQGMRFQSTRLLHLVKLRSPSNSQTGLSHIPQFLSIPNREVERQDSLQLLVTEP